MGLLNLPDPVLTKVDAWLVLVLPPGGALLVWAAMGALLSMECYRLLSPQGRIADLKAALAEQQRRAKESDEDFQRVWLHIRRALALALRRVLVVLPATIAASIPLLLIVVWLDTQYGRQFPQAGETVSAEISGPYRVTWVEAVGPSDAPGVKIVAPNGDTVAMVPVRAPVPILHKWHWWNALIGNPAGYLPDSLPVDRVRLDFSRREVLPIGPDWLRGWEALFFGGLVLFAVGFKWLRRIE